MADFQDMLNDVLSDPEKMSQIMSIASSFASSASDDADEKPSTDDTSFNSSSTNSRGFSDSLFGDDFDIMSKVMPMISDIMSSSQTSISDEKKNLISALDPFVTDDVSASMRKSIRLISIAKIAKTAFQKFPDIKRGG